MRACRSFWNTSIVVGGGGGGLVLVEVKSVLDFIHGRHVDWFDLEEDLWFQKYDLAVFDLSAYKSRKSPKLGRNGSLYQSTRQKNSPPTTQKPVFSQDQLAQDFHSVTRNANLTSASSKPSGTQEPFSS
jgi:hypothetical protein